MNHNYKHNNLERPAHTLNIGWHKSKILQPLQIQKTVDPNNEHEN